MQREIRSGKIGIDYKQLLFLSFQAYSVTTVDYC
jgi:hypothetical protein